MNFWNCIKQSLLKALDFCSSKIRIQSSDLYIVKPEPVPEPDHLTIQPSVVTDESPVPKGTFLNPDQAASPLLEQQSENFSNTEAQSHKEKGSTIHADKRTAAVLRRATYTISPGKSEEAANRAFEVLDPEESPVFSEWPEFGVKKRYVFVHSPPGESSNYKTLDMDLTAVTNHSLSASRDESNKSQANKSRFNHDDQIIRPWGNIQAEKPTATKVTKPQAKTKPPTNASKSKLPMPEKKESGKTGKELKESSKICPAKKSKDIKKASKKSKKNVLMSAKNDLGVFDLSAGESFSLPPPIMKRMNSKPSDILTGLAKDSGNDQEAVGCFVKQGKPKLPVTKEKQPDPMHQEEQLKTIHQVHFEVDVEELLLQNEQLDPMCQVKTEKEHRGSMIKQKSKKARSVVTPGIDKTAAVGQGTKLSIIAASWDLGADDILDGTYLGGLPPRPDQKQPACSERVIKTVEAEDKEMLKPTPHASSNKKQKNKALKHPSSKLDKDDVKTEMIPPQNQISHSVLRKSPSTKTYQPSGIPKAMPQPHAFDDSPSSDILTDDLCICRGSSKSSPLATPVLSIPGCSHPSPTVDASRSSLSPKKRGGDKGSSNQSKRGQKRRAEALEEQKETTIERGEEEIVTSVTIPSSPLPRLRHCRRGKAVCYKEQRLNCKLRRECSPVSKTKTKKKTSNKRVEQREALGTGTNIE